jgi:hypothetical protein
VSRTIGHRSFSLSDLNVPVLVNKKSMPGSQESIKIVFFSSKKENLDCEEIK